MLDEEAGQQESCPVRASHAKLVETWENWANRINFKYRQLDPSRARHFLEKRLSDVNKEYSGTGRLPWPAKTP